MTHLFSRCAIACGLGILALAGPANAASELSVPGTAVVVPVGRAAGAGAFDRPDVRAYGPDIWYDGADNDPAGYEPNLGGADEIRELQRAFPQTNWPPSMRY